MTDDDDHARHQRPGDGRLALDHIAHFLPDMTTAERDLARLGFTLTPLSHQIHRVSPDAPPASAGTANRTAMLERGYLEFLTTTGDTPNAAKLKAAMARYTGAHLVCFGTTQPDAVHARLAAQGFEPPPVVALQRDVETAAGATATARFRVVRAGPDRMPEGRIQVVEHVTPDLIWQPRWLRHANGASSLAAVAICVADIDEAALRWHRFTGLPVRASGDLRVIATERGQVLLGSAAGIERHFGATPPHVPWIAGPILGTRDPQASRRMLEAAGARLLRETAGRVVFAAPPSIGGILGFQLRV